MPILRIIFMVLWLLLKLFVFSVFILIFICIALSGGGSTARRPTTRKYRDDS